MKINMKGRPERFLFLDENLSRIYFKAECDSVSALVHPAAERCFPPSCLYVPPDFIISLMRRWLCGTDPAESRTFFHVLLFKQLSSQTSLLHRYWWHKVVQMRKELNHK